MKYIAAFVVAFMTLLLSGRDVAAAKKKGDCVVIDTYGCESGAPHFDKQGDVCRNDGQADEAHCNYDYGPNACVVCGCEIYDDNGCEPGAPHFDPQGMVCANDHQSDEAYCNYNFGPKACVIGCRSFVYDSDDDDS